MQEVKVVKRRKYYRIQLQKLRIKLINSHYSGEKVDHIGPTAKVLSIEHVIENIWPINDYNRNLF